MKLIVKFFPEITIKSKPVRTRFARQLRDNLKVLLRPIDAQVSVKRDWDKLVIDVTPANDDYQAVLDVLTNTPGIAYFLEVLEYPLGDFDDIFQKTRTVYEAQLEGKTFAVRCKRAGKHDFNSGDVERYVGGGLNLHTAAAGVKLKDPDVTVRIEIRDDTLFIVREQHKGLGGFPLGCVDPVLSLISGGFDSTVSSYLTMKRGMRTHFCFFNLGGSAHEIAVKEVALYLWLKYGASHRVKFVAVPFEEVVAEILQHIANSQMGVILKRMMLRAGSRVAEKLGVEALVTGESVAQVSSQTLANLAVIDSATDTLVLRPLITSDKLDIIHTAAEIGTEDFAKNIPEYCGVISVKPTTRAKPEKIAHEESRFDFAVLEKAIENARYQTIDEIVDEDLTRTDVEVLPVPLPDCVVIDVRHPNEQEQKPLRIAGTPVEAIPFFELHSRAEELGDDKTYMLYCDRGMMSRLHAAHLVDQGFTNIKVYRPS
jgi:thiamine biosynthesis protein ThiI